MENNDSQKLVNAIMANDKKTATALLEKILRDKVAKRIQTTLK